MRVKVFCRVWNDSSIPPSPNTRLRLDDKVERVLSKLTSTFSAGQSTEDVYEATARKLVDGFVHGENVSFLVFGPARSGKRFTLLGTSMSRTGIVPCTFASVFEQLGGWMEGKPWRTCEVRLSCMQIYDETIRDLCATDPLQRESMEVEYSPAHGYNIAALTQTRVTSASEATTILRLALECLQPETSSAIVIALHLRMTEHSQVTENNKTLHSTFTFIALPSADHLSHDSVESRILAGPLHNTALLAVKSLVDRLAEMRTPNRFVPYDKSVLTKLLEDSLGGNSHTQCLLTLTASSLQQDGLQAVISLANQMALVENYPVLNTRHVKDLLCLHRAATLHFKKMNALTGEGAARSDKELHQENVQLKKDAIDLEKEVGSLSDLLAELERAKGPQLRQQQKFVKASQTAVQLKMENLELQDKLVSVEVKGEETSIRLQDLQKEMENLQRQLADLSAVHGRVVNELSSQSRNASTLREKLDEQVTKNEELQLEIVHLLAVKQSTKGQSVGTAGPPAEAQKRLDGANSSMAYADGAEYSLQRQINQLHKTLNDVREQSFREQSSLRQKVSDLEGTRARLEQKLISAGTERQAELSANIKRLERELQHSESESMSLRRQMAEMKSDLQLATSRVTHISAQLEAEKMACGRSDEERAKMSSKYTRLVEEFQSRLQDYLLELKRSEQAQFQTLDVKRYINNMLADFQAAEDFDKRRLVKDCEQNRARYKSVADVYTTLLYCYTKARDNLLAMDAPSPGPDPSKFKLPDLDDKLLAEGERISPAAVLSEKLKDADEAIKKYKEDLGKQAALIKSLQDRLRESEASAVKAARRRASEYERDDVVRGLQQQVDELTNQVSVLSAQGSDMSDALVPVMTGHDGRFDESQAAELIAAQESMREELYEVRSKMVLAEESIRSYQTYINTDLAEYHERAIVLNNALTELLEMYAAAGGHLQDLSSLPPNLAQALIREPQGEG